MNVAHGCRFGLIASPDAAVEKAGQFRPAVGQRCDESDGDEEAA